MRMDGKRLAPIMAMLALSVAGCGQVGMLKAKKVARDAHTAYSQQDYKKAAALYEEAIKADPEGTGDLYFYLGNSYDNLYKPSRQGEAENDAFLQKAVENYRLGIERSTDPLVKRRSLEYLVAAYGPDKLNDPTEQIPIVEQMIKVEPKEPSNYFTLAKIYEDMGEYTKAEETLLKANEVRPNNSEVYMQLVGFYNRQGEFGKTMEYLQKRAELEPNNPEVHHTIAAFYWEKAYRDFSLKDAEKQKFADLGLQAANRALELKPDYIEAITFKGLLLRVQALLEKKDAARQKALLAEAEALTKKATELQKKKIAGVGTQP